MIIYNSVITEAVMKIRLHGQAVKTLASHAGIRGSIPLGVTIKKCLQLFCRHFFIGMMDVMKIRLHGQAVKTLASHAGIRGSIPLGVTIKKCLQLFCRHFFIGMMDAYLLKK